MDQLSLFDDAPPAQHTHIAYRDRAVVFFGIRLPELGPEAAEVCRMLRRSHGLTGTPYDAGRLHISLLRVGYRDALSAAEIDMLQRAASEVTVSPFPISFESVFSFDGHTRTNARPAVVFPVADGAAEIISLARDIEARLHRRLTVEGGPPPAPHMTLLRDRIPVPLTALAPPFGARVTGFELICSHRKDHRYETLWP